jgi:hypothetical protein
MNYMNKKIVLLSLITAFVAGCNKEKNENDFAEKDCYITAFSLQQGDATFNAVIADTAITVIAPENISLRNATATVTLSENAAINPDPETISDWEKEWQFTVVAPSGARTKYRYTLERNVVVADGDVKLETQADVDAFGLRNITVIDGNLTVGRSAGTDSITSLAPLASLKKVNAVFVVNHTCKIAGLEDLENLQHVGTLQIVKTLENLTLPALKTAGNINLKNAVTHTVNLPELVDVSNTLNLDCPLSRLQLPNLQTVGTLTLATVYNSNASTPDEISLPALKEAGDIEIVFYRKTAKINLPALKKANRISLNTLERLGFIYIPALEEVTQSFRIYRSNIMTEFILPELIQAGEFTVHECTTLHVLEAPKLTRAGKIEITEAPVENLNFNALQSANTVIFRSLKREKIELAKELPAIAQKIDFFQVYTDAKCLPLKDINIKGVAVGTLSLWGFMKTEKITGDEVFHGTLEINMANTFDPYPENLPVLDGFGEIDSLNIMPHGMSEVHVRGVRKINRGAWIGTGHAARPHSFSFPDLESVGGDFKVWLPYMTQSTLSSLTFDRLVSVGGNFTLNIGAATADELNCPELKTIGGDFELCTSFDNDGLNRRGLKNLNFPKLETINGKLFIYPASSIPASSDYDNERLENLNGFVALRKVGAIEISMQAALKDFTGLKNAFESLATPENWSVNRCGYNPDYEQMKKGQYTKPD